MAFGAFFFTKSSPKPTLDLLLGHFQPITKNMFDPLLCPSNCLTILSLRDLRPIIDPSHKWGRNPSGPPEQGGITLEQFWENVLCPSPKRAKYEMTREVVKNFAQFVAQTFAQLINICHFALGACFCVRPRLERPHRVWELQNQGS